MPSGAFLQEDEAKRLIAGYGIVLPRERLVHSPAGAIEAARELGYPVVLKVVSPDVAHKTEAGGVKLGLGSDDEVAAAYEQILKDVPARQPGARISGVLVAEHIPVEQEMLCGMSRNPEFGPVIAFGLGGIFVEVLKDIAHGVLPLEEIDALEIRGIKGYPVISGARGRKPVDEHALAGVLLAVAKLAEEHPEVAELDINPLALARDGRLVALDCLVKLADG